ncbi:hypothetical protein TNCV_3469221 [Trichonephila clavipes]|nr:hypothetical protein TNCV_3469221 [Trichonephila clavipes]
MRDPRKEGGEKGILECKMERSNIWSIKDCQKSTNSPRVSDYDIERRDGQSNTPKKMKCQQTSVNPDLLSDCVPHTYRTNTLHTHPPRIQINSKKNILFPETRFIRKRQNSVGFYFW